MSHGVPPYHPGPILATPGAQEALGSNGQTAQEFLSRHFAGDWGEMDKHDRAVNDDALKNGSRILSSYSLKDGTTIWVITDGEIAPNRRYATTVLLPSEY